MALPEAVLEYVGADPSALPDAALGERIADLEELVRRAQAAQAAAIRLFDARDGADGDGAASTASWLRDRLNAADRDARRAVGLARSLDRFPLLTAALHAGETTTAHARTLAAQTRHLDRGTVAGGEAFLVDLARRLDPVRFATAVRCWVAVVAPAEFERDTQRRYDSRWLSVSATYGGMTSIAGMLDPEGGALVRDALAALVASNARDDVRSRDQQRADALVDLVELARSHQLLPVSGGHRPEILVHVSADQLRAAGTGATAGPDAGPAVGASVATATAGIGAAAGAAARAGAAGTGPPVLGDGSPLVPAAAERLACDATFRRLVLDARDVPVALGRATRLVPPALRKQLALRDGGCRYPGCPRGAAFCDAHHVVHWRHGGPTDLDNLVLLCRYHHHLVHDRGHALALRPDGDVAATRPDGRRLTSKPRGPTFAAV